MWGPIYIQFINPLSPESCFEFLHIFAYIFVRMYRLPQFRQFRHKGRLSLDDSNITWDEREAILTELHLEALCSSSQIWTLERLGVNQ